MTSAYDDIYSRFYLRITDYDLANQSERVAKEMMNGWMQSTLSKPYVRRLFASLSIDGDLEEIEYVLKFPVSENEDRDFVEEVIAMGMVVQWLSPKYQSTLNAMQLFSNSEQKFYSQAAHMAELKDMYNLAKNDLRKLIRDKGYIYNSYLSEA